MAKRNVSGFAKAAVFNYSTPSARVAVGAAETEKKEGKPVKWGDKDDLPHHYLRLIAASGTANSCLHILETFIAADGFRDKAAAAFEVNEYQTADSFLQDVAGDVAALNGLALRVRYAEGEVLIENLALECVRKLDNGEFLFNPTMGQEKYDKNKNEILPGYSNLEALKQAATEDAEGMAEKGQIYYYYFKTKGAYEYPKPIYATTGGLADIENDAEISLYDLDEVKSGFRLNAIMTAIGNYDDVQDNEGNLIENPDLANLKEQLGSFTERKDTTEARKKILLLTAETAELVPKLEPFNNSKSLELLDAVTMRIANKVCRHMITPPPLAGIQVAGQLGQTQEIVNMIQLFQMRILKFQNMIQRVMEELYPSTESKVTSWEISTLNPLQFIPDYVIGLLDDTQKKTLISRYI